MRVRFNGNHIIEVLFCFLEHNEILGDSLGCTADSNRFQYLCRKDVLCALLCKLGTGRNWELYQMVC